MFQFLRNFVDNIQNDEVNDDLKLLDKLDKQQKPIDDHDKYLKYLTPDDADMDDMEMNSLEHRFMDDKERNPFLFVNNKLNRLRSLSSSTAKPKQLNLFEDFLELARKEELENEAFTSDTAISALGGLNLWQFTAIILALMLFCGRFGYFFLCWIFFEFFLYYEFYLNSKHSLAGCTNGSEGSSTTHPSESNDVK